MNWAWFHGMGRGMPILSTETTRCLLRCGVVGSVGKGRHLFGKGVACKNQKKKAG